MPCSRDLLTQGSNLHLRYFGQILYHCAIWESSYRHAMECYSATREDSLPFATAWTEDIMLSAISQRQTSAVWPHSRVESVKSKLVGRLSWWF